jgi:hypothetical protein
LKLRQLSCQFFAQKKQITAISLPFSRVSTRFHAQSRKFTPNHANSRRMPASQPPAIATHRYSATLAYNLTSVYWHEAAMARRKHAMAGQSQCETPAKYFLTYLLKYCKLELGAKI